MRLFSPRNWIKRFRPALIIACLMSVIGFSWVIPPQEAYFPLQRHLQEIWIIILGVAAIPFWLATLDAPLMAVIIILIIGLVVGLLIQVAFWSKGSLRKILLLSLLLFNLICGFLLLAIGVGGGTLQNDPAIECERINASGEGTRIVRYTQVYVDGSTSHFFFLSTSNSGKTWNQVGSASYVAGISSCSEEHSYGNTDFNYYTCLPEAEARPAWLCFSNAENNLPDFITSIDYQQQANTAKICIDLNPQALWESGNQADELTQKMLTSFEVAIDDQIVPNDAIIFSGLSSSRPVYDENNKFIGTYPINFLACIQKSDLMNGAHTAAIQLASISNIQYTYTWEFQFPESFALS